MGLTSDPWSQGNPQGAGLRIPPILPGDTTANRPRYLFCLATRKILNDCKLIGIRQGVTIGNLIVTTPFEEPSTFYPLEFFVTTPTWRFMDGNISWHLVYEGNDFPETHHPILTDTNNWAQNVSDSPAMLYRTFANTNVNPNTGAPLDYVNTLTAYTPPQLQLTWEPVAADLKCWYDLRFPYQSDHAWEAFGEEGINLKRGRRISLYASILQTNPATRVLGVHSIGGAGPPVTIEAPNGLPPEEAFLSLTGSVAGFAGAIYWRVLGALIFDDQIEDRDGRG